MAPFVVPIPMSTTCCFLLWISSSRIRHLTYITALNTHRPCHSRYLVNCTGSWSSQVILNCYEYHDLLVFFHLFSTTLFKETSDADGRATRDTRIVSPRDDAIYLITRNTVNTVVPFVNFQCRPTRVLPSAKFTRHA